MCEATILAYNIIGQVSFWYGTGQKVLLTLKRQLTVSIARLYKPGNSTSQLKSTGLMFYPLRNKGPNISDLQL